MKEFRQKVVGHYEGGSKFRYAAVRRHVAIALSAFASLAVVGFVTFFAGAQFSRASGTPSLPSHDRQAGEKLTVSLPPASRSDLRVRRFTGRVGPDLSKALEAAGVPQRQGREYVALLARAIPLANGLCVDDRFDLILQRDPDGSFGQLVYAGMDRVARADVELMKWSDGKHIIWVNAEGIGGEVNEAMRLPVEGRLTSGFGNRFHPILGYERFHAGVDLAAAAGTPIVAAADGKVASAGWHGGYGRSVQIIHSGGIETLYGHMSRVVAFTGETIQRGEVIGYVGSTGLSTGPHLHFEVMKNGRPVNPLSVNSIGSGAGQLKGEKLVEFQNQLRGMLLAEN